ncbi:MAG: hypothetical protein V1816_18140 [Pseudomonadota bacterium]
MDGRGADDFPGRLFAAAYLAERRDLGVRERAEIIGAVGQSGPGSGGLEPRVRFDPEQWVATLNRRKPDFGKMERAAAWARAWRDRGVRAITPAEAGMGLFAAGVPAVLFTWGDGDVLSRPLAAILNSRKPQTMKPGDPWIEASREMFRTAAAAGSALATSWGERQYELTWRLAAEAKVPALVVCPGPLPGPAPGLGDDGFMDRYGEFMVPGRTLFMSLFSPGSLPPPRTLGLMRDVGVAGLARVIFAAEIRAGGTIEALARQALRAGVDVRAFVFDRRTNSNDGNFALLESGARPFNQGAFPVGPVSRRRGAGRTSGTPAASADLAGRLIHFTRSCPGPWPGQGLYDYYGALLRGDPGAAHAGFDALKRILEEKLIRGSGRLTRGRIPVVSFTSLGPESLPRLIQWRPALARWTMEPYGLSLDKKTLRHLGARPVIYGAAEVWDRLPARQGFRFQMEGAADAAWRKEREWRVPGSLDLGLIRPGDMIALVPSAAEARELETAFGIRARALFPG